MSRFVVWTLPLLLTSCGWFWSPATPPTTPAPVLDEDADDLDDLDELDAFEDDLEDGGEGSFDEEGADADTAAAPE